MNYKNISELAANGDYDKCLEIIKNKIDMDSIDDTINTFNKYLKTRNKKDINIETYNKVLDVLNEIKSNTLINLFIDKEPYIKDITDDKIINLTGQSGSGKSTYVKEYLNTNDYLIVDTDDVLSEDRFKTSTGINKELGKYFRKKFLNKNLSANTYKEI